MGKMVEYGNPIANNNSSEFEKIFSVQMIYLQFFYLRSKKFKKKYRFSDFDLQPYIPESKSLIEEKN